MNSKKQTVLVADDDPRLLKLIQRNLEMSNYRVVTVSDGPSVLRQAEAEEPDLYVLDIMMPGLDGREVTRRLREFSIAPVLMLTAKDTEDDKVAGLEAGADDYLTKPFGVNELLARVRMALRHAAKPSTGTEPIIRLAEIELDLERLWRRVYALQADRRFPARSEILRAISPAVFCPAAAERSASVCGSGFPHPRRLSNLSSRPSSERRNCGSSARCNCLTT